MHSMTGCGRCQVSDGTWEITVELRSVNHRFLDVSCRLPRSLSFLEDTVRKVLSASLKRGHVDVFVTVTNTAGGNRDIQVDEMLATRYEQAAKQLAHVTGCVMDMTASQLLRMEGVVTVAEAAMDETHISELCKQAAEGAVHQLTDMRSAEGVNLAIDLRFHLEAVAALRERIVQRAPMVVREYRQKLLARLSAMQVEDVDPARLAQEVALMADKCAIDEELSRLESHIGQMNNYLKAQGEIGKKMDFLIQEMNREANTIGSKASDAIIAQHVVDLKSEIEKLREQVQNVE